MIKKSLIIILSLFFFWSPVFAADPKASRISVTDTGNYYSESNVEAVLQEVGYSLNHLPSGYSDEQVDDRVAVLIQNGTGISWIYNDTLNTLTPSVSITQYTDALARSSISETTVGLDYSSSTGVLSTTSGYVIPSTTEETNWNTAYGWGNHVSAGYLTTLTLAVATKTTNYTLTANDGLIFADATGGSFTLTLPSAVGITGVQYHIKKVDSTANTVTVNTTLSQKIDEDLTQVLGYQWTSITLVSNGSNWFIL